MAKLGFKSAKIGIMDDKEQITEMISLNQKKGGAIDAKISGLAPETSKVFASNIAFYVSSVGTGDVKVDLTAFDISEEEMGKIIGAELVEGVLQIGSTTQAPYCTLLLESNGVKNDDLYVALTKGKFSYDGDEFKTNEDKGNEPGTDALTGDFIARGSDGLSYLKARSSNEEFTLEKFMKLVFPGYTAPAGKNISLDVDQPTALAADPKITQVTLNWEGAEDVEFEVKRNGEIIATISELTYKDTGLTAGTEYIYTVATVKEGKHSEPVELKIKTKESSSGGE